MHRHLSKQLTVIDEISERCKYLPLLYARPVRSIINQFLSEKCEAMRPAKGVWTHHLRLEGRRKVRACQGVWKQVVWTWQEKEGVNFRMSSRLFLLAFILFGPVTSCSIENKMGCWNTRGETIFYFDDLDLRTSFWIMHWLYLFVYALLLCVCIVCIVFYDIIINFKGPSALLSFWKTWICDLNVKITVTCIMVNWLVHNFFCIYLCQTYTEKCP